MSNSSLVNRLQTKLHKETHSRELQQNVNSKLQNEYDQLLKRLAEAENHIDQLRLQSNMNVNRRFIVSHQHRYDRARNGNSSGFDQSHRPLQPHSDSNTTTANACIGTSWGDSEVQDIEEGETIVSLDERQRQDSALDDPSLYRYTLDVHTDQSQATSHEPTPDSTSSAHPPAEDASSASTDGDETCISQMSVTTISDRGSVESIQYAHLLKIKSLQGKLAELKSKLNDRGSSFDEILMGLQEVQREHRQLSEDIGNSQSQLKSLKEKYRGSASKRIAGSQQAIETELATLADQLGDLMQCLQLKANEAQSTSPSGSPVHNSPPRYGNSSSPLGPHLIHTSTSQSRHPHTRHKVESVDRNTPPLSRVSATESALDAQLNRSQSQSAGRDDSDSVAGSELSYDSSPYLSSKYLSSTTDVALPGQQDRSHDTSNDPLQASHDTTRDFLQLSHESHGNPGPSLHSQVPTTENDHIHQAPTEQAGGELHSLATPHPRDETFIVRSKSTEKRHSPGANGLQSNTQVPISRVKHITQTLPKSLATGSNVPPLHPNKLVQSQSSSAPLHTPLTPPVAASSRPHSYQSASGSSTPLTHPHSLVAASSHPHSYQSASGSSTPLTHPHSLVAASSHPHSYQSASGSSTPLTHPHSLVAASSHPHSYQSASGSRTPLTHSHLTGNEYPHFTHHTPSQNDERQSARSTSQSRHTLSGKSSDQSCRQTRESLEGLVGSSQSVVENGLTSSSQSTVESENSQGEGKQDYTSLTVSAIDHLRKELDELKELMIRAHTPRRTVAQPRQGHSTHRHSTRSYTPTPTHSSHCSRTTRPHHSTHSHTPESSLKYYCAPHMAHPPNTSPVYTSSALPSSTLVTPSPPHTTPRRTVHTEKITTIELSSPEHLSSSLPLSTPTRSVSETRTPQPSPSHGELRENSTPSRVDLTASWYLESTSGGAHRPVRDLMTPQPTPLRKFSTGSSNTRPTVSASHGPSTPYSFSEQFGSVSETTTPRPTPTHTEFGTKSEVSTPSRVSQPVLEHVESNFSYRKPDSTRFSSGGPSKSVSRVKTPQPSPSPEHTVFSGGSTPLRVGHTVTPHTPPKGVRHDPPNTRSPSGHSHRSATSTRRSSSPRSFQTDHRNRDGSRGDTDGWSTVNPIEISDLDERSKYSSEFKSPRHQSSVKYTPSKSRTKSERSSESRSSGHEVDDNWSCLQCGGKGTSSLSVSPSGARALVHSHKCSQTSTSPVRGKGQSHRPSPRTTKTSHLSPTASYTHKSTVKKNQGVQVSNSQQREHTVQTHASRSPSHTPDHMILSSTGLSAVTREHGARVSIGSGEEPSFARVATSTPTKKKGRESYTPTHHRPSSQEHAHYSDTLSREYPRTAALGESQDPYILHGATGSTATPRPNFKRTGGTQENGPTSRGASRYSTHTPTTSIGYSGTGGHVVERNMYKVQAGLYSSPDSQSSSRVVCDAPVYTAHTVHPRVSYHDGRDYWRAHSTPHHTPLQGHHYTPPTTSPEYRHSNYHHTTSSPSERIGSHSSEKPRASSRRGSAGYSIPADGELFFSEPTSKSTRRGKRRKAKGGHHRTYVKPVSKRVYVLEKRSGSDSEPDIEVVEGPGLDLDEALQLAKTLKRRSRQMHGSLKELAKLHNF